MFRREKKKKKRTVTIDLFFFPSCFFSFVFFFLEGMKGELNILAKIIMYRRIINKYYVNIETCNDVVLDLLVLDLINHNYFSYREN